MFIHGLSPLAPGLIPKVWSGVLVYNIRMIKTCSVCKQNLDISNFYFIPKRKYYESRCNKCRISYQVLYIKKNKKIFQSHLWAYSQIRKMKKRALCKKISFEISMEDICRLRSLPCIYCGQQKTHEETSIDRKDNSLGYTLDNCLPCCRLCNEIKGRTLTYDEMLEVGKIISKRYK